MQIGNKIKKETDKLDGIFAHRTRCFTILPFLNSQIFMHFQSRRFSKFQDFWPMEIMPYQRHCLSPKIILLHGKHIILFNIANSLKLVGFSLNGIFYIKYICAVIAQCTHTFHPSKRFLTVWALQKWCPFVHSFLKLANDRIPLFVSTSSLKRN